MVVTAADQAALVQEQLPDAAVLVEPCPRNTAACLGYAATYLLKTIGDIPMLCLPADHLIQGLERITRIYTEGLELARTRPVLVTIGIKPTAPETGYGYIHRGNRLDDSPAEVYAVQQFVEKPDRLTAERYMQSGAYYWNSGMFIWRPSTILAAIRTFLPQLANTLDLIGTALGTNEEEEKLSSLYSEIKPVSIDVGIMERAENVLMLPGDLFTWSDVGSWSSWAESAAAHADSSGNVVRGDAVTIQSKNCAVVGAEKFIALVGLENIVVVDTKDALLVCHKDKAQEVKAVVDALAEKKRGELL